MEAKRYNLSSNPADFTKNQSVLKELQEKGNDILPITLINDKVVKLVVTLQMKKFKI